MDRSRRETITPSIGCPYAYLENSELRDLDYFDRQFKDIDHVLTAIEAYRLISYPMPWIVQKLMSARDFISRPFGIQPIQGFNNAAVTHRNGRDYLDFFELIHLDNAKLKLVSSDHHLDVMLVIEIGEHSGSPRVIVSARVKCKNWIGHVYMLPVRPIHRLLISHMMRRLTRRPTKT